MDITMIVLLCINSALIGINLITQHYWVIPINILAILFCILSIYRENK